MTRSNFADAPSPREVRPPYRLWVIKLRSQHAMGNSCAIHAMLSLLDWHLFEAERPRFCPGFTHQTQPSSLGESRMNDLRIGFGGIDYLDRLPPLLDGTVKPEGISLRIVSFTE